MIASATRFSFMAAIVAVSFAAVGCNNYSHQLERGQSYYEANNYELALAMWRNLEDDQDSLSDSEFVRYCYLRGMTDYRLKYRPDARYWLGLAKAGQRDIGDGLNDDEMQRLEVALTELSREVYGLGADVHEAEGADNPEAGALGKKCQWTSQCEEGYICQGGSCVQVKKGE